MTTSVRRKTTHCAIPFLVTSGAHIDAAATVSGNILLQMRQFLQSLLESGQPTSPICKQPNEPFVAFQLSTAFLDSLAVLFFPESIRTPTVESPLRLSTGFV
jgi:hypothetical protein